MQGELSLCLELGAEGSEEDGHIRRPDVSDRGANRLVERELREPGVRPGRLHHVKSASNQESAAPIVFVPAVVELHTTMPFAKGRP